MQEFGLVLAVTVLAVISPGGDFAMVTRNSFLHGRMAGIWTAIGIALAIWLHVAYSILLLQTSPMLLQTSPMLLQAVKTVGALYLLFIAWQTWRHSVAATAEIVDTQSAFSHWSALKTGLISNAFNPKTTLFVLSLYTQVIRDQYSLEHFIGLRLDGFFGAFAVVCVGGAVFVAATRAFVAIGQAKRGEQDDCGCVDAVGRIVVMDLNRCESQFTGRLCEITVLRLAVFKSGCPSPLSIKTRKP